MSSFAFVPSTSLVPRTRFRSTVCARRPRRASTPKCVIGPTADYYREAEDLDDATSNMDIWNNVIYASLKRKLSNLPHTPMHSLSSLIPPTEEPPQPAATQQLPPLDVINNLMLAFERDAMRGAAMFVQVASPRNHVRTSTPARLVLFVSDNESYRIMLRVESFSVIREQFGEEGQCVVRAEVRGGGEEAVFDFMLSQYDGEWLIDEVFRL